MDGGLACIHALMLELMSSMMSGCVLSSFSTDLRLHISESHCNCEDCCGHCRMCVVVSSS